MKVSNKSDKLTVSEILPLEVGRKKMTENIQIAPDVPHICELHMIISIVNESD